MSPKYDLHKLGWKAFQDLCHTVLGEVLGQTVESMLDTHDGGQDGAFTGTWRTQAGEDLKGRFVLQCKHTTKRDRNLRPSDLSDELAKAAKLVGEGRCDSYLLLTNAGMTARTRSKIEKSLRNTGVKHTRLFDATWINAKIHESSRLRMLVPRIYGLGDLSQILDERAYRQARAILASMREDLAKVVLTATYRKAVAALDAHGFVLLVGEPAAGKTTIASLLAMTATDHRNASPLKLEHPSKFADHWNPDDRNQLFWLDDAFGVTQYEHHLVLAWNQVLPRLQPMLRHGATIVMTSRDYIYNRARDTLKGSAFPLLNESRVVVDVRDLTLGEKRQILYNHLRLGNQPHSYLSRLKPHLESVAQHDRFIPETARRLGTRFFTKSLHPSSYALERFVRRQESFLRDVVKGLDTDSRAALALIYLRGGKLKSPVELRSREEKALRRLGSQLGSAIDALQAMNGSLVRRIDPGDGASWQFKHPTIGDAYAFSLAANPEHLAIYVEGGDPKELVNQVTCGDVQVEKAIVLTSELFPQMATKLDELQHGDTWKGRYRRRRATTQFLSRRCGKEFLSVYLRRNPGLLDEVASPGLFLDAVPEVDLAAKLHQLGLLPEEHRKRFVRTASSYALQGEDLYALWAEELRPLFTDGEFQELERRLRSELLPRLDDIRYEWESEWEDQYDRTDTAEEHMSKRIEDLDSLEQHFARDTEVVEEIKRQRAALQSWIWDNMPENHESLPRRSGLPELPDLGNSGRSVFDDLDSG